METDQGLITARRRRAAEREGRLRTCQPARLPARDHEARDRKEHQETVDQDWNVVRGED
ncbi:hypothetical protein OG875_01980 [Streptomyces sp. NBC_01498]|uniref:hypothetical protein n=1 Tax=Streptomyces sp. NBC_01498 TaxID=2975870 RepID=UPI002E7C1DF9|nr:hypothetical protein [Streptomyces sp. NBC_01498]WTL23475.1 hypothetical protein OG875_01980 [Streptomyces sp. NBC_01498]